MPYADPDKQRECVKLSARRRVARLRGTPEYTERQKGHYESAMAIPGNRVRKNVLRRARIAVLRETPEGWLAERLAHTRNAARRKGIPFDLTVSDFTSIPEVCPIFGISLVFEVASGSRAHGVATLDRLDPSKGYVKGNVRIISHHANRLKNNASRPELEAILAYMLAAGL